jgi:hypothetical protein
MNAIILNFNKNIRRLNFLKLNRTFFSSKSQKRENLTDINDTFDKREIPDYKLILDKNFVKGFYLINVPLYFSTLYLFYLKHRVPFLEDDFTNIFRLAINLLNISQCMHSGLSIGIVSRHNSVIESEDEVKVGKEMKRTLFVNFLSSFASYTVSYVLLTSNVITNFHIYFCYYWLISFSQILANYYGVKKQFLPSSLIKIQIYNFAIFTLFLGLFYFIVKDKKELIKRKMDANRIEQIKTIPDIELEEEYMISKENEELMKISSDILDNIYNQEESNFNVKL